MIDKISKIYHIADIHCRNFKRHKEYRKVFDRTFKYIKSTKDENSIIYLAGDIVHSKTDMTPELIDLVSYFLKSCADLCTTILICGNHDAALAATHRLDALSPIVAALNHPNLYYWKDSEVHELGGVCFTVYSVFGPTADWKLAKDIEYDGMKIVLHHGSVMGAKTDLGHSIENDLVRTSIFDGADLVLLGDIHYRQFLNDERTIYFAGSLIQQNHGEELEKGITVWDLKTKRAEFIKIENDIAYVTLNIKDGKIISDKSYVDSWPKKIRLRIKYETTLREQLQHILAALKKKFTIEEVSFQRSNMVELVKNDSVVLDNVRDIEYQNKLITEYIQQKNIFNVDVDHLRHINRVINSELNSATKVIRNIKWNPINLEFSNMFSYGPNNQINFQSLKGIQGIFSQNQQGKSSLLDILTYCIYDKCSRTYKAKDVLNNQKSRFRCKLEFELNGEVYSIEREGFKDARTGKVRVEVDFFKYDLDNNKIPLNGIDRDETNKFIRDYLGTYDDFLLTTLSTQNDNKNFIFKTQRERKELLYSFLDLSIFDELHNIGKKSIKEKSDKLIIAETELYSSEYSNLDLNHKLITTELNEIQSELDIKQNELLSIQTKLQQKNKQLIPIKDSIEWNDYCEEELLDLKEELKIIKQSIITKNPDKLDDQIQNVLKLLDDKKFSDLDNRIVIRNIYNTQLADLQYKFSDASASISELNDTIEKLKDHKFDPNCKYCIDNQFVKDAYAAKEILPVQLSIKDDLKTKITELQKKVESNLDNLKQEFDGLNKKLLNLNQQKLHSSIEYTKYIQRENEISLSIDKLIQTKTNFETIEASVEHNKKIENEISVLQKTNTTLNTAIGKLGTRIIEKSTELQLIQSKQERKKVLLNNIEELQATVNLYNAYIEMMHNDGIPYLILQKILPVIENEVNIILSDIVDFTCKFESDEKSNINCYLLHTDENNWPVEMASGMERFMVSLAIRCALVDITNLPRPNFMAIDEGFGTLDSDKISSMVLLFEYMRSKFDFVIAVSHVDTMRDMVDGLIDVHKNKQGFSEVGVIQ